MGTLLMYDTVLLCKCFLQEVNLLTVGLPFLPFLLMAQRPSTSCGPKTVWGEPREGGGTTCCWALSVPQLTHLRASDQNDHQHLWVGHPSGTMQNPRFSTYTCL